MAKKQTIAEITSTIECIEKYTYDVMLQQSKALSSKQKCKQVAFAWIWKLGEYMICLLLPDWTVTLHFQNCFLPQKTIGFYQENEGVKSHSEVFQPS